MDFMDEVSKSDQEWKQILSPEEFGICRKKETEAPFTGKYTHSKEDGIYRCTCCKNELFSSDTKFDSGTGWPSFFEPLKENSVRYETDTAYGMTRTEVMCAKCGSHLGHVFDDGPKPTFARYCINSVSLKLEKTTDNKTNQT